jgi:hypothetical protein
MHNWRLLRRAELHGASYHECVNNHIKIRDNQQLTLLHNKHISAVSRGNIALDDKMLVKVKNFDYLMCSIGSRETNYI